MRRHPTDPVSLVFGLLFLGVALLWGTTGRGTLTRQSIIDEPGWRLPLLLVGVPGGQPVGATRRQFLIMRGWGGRPVWSGWTGPGAGHAGGSNRRSPNLYATPDCRAGPVARRP